MRGVANVDSYHHVASSAAWDALLVRDCRRGRFGRDSPLAARGAKGIDRDDHNQCDRDGDDKPVGPHPHPLFRCADCREQLAPLTAVLQPGGLRPPRPSPPTCRARLPEGDPTGGRSCRTSPRGAPAHRPQPHRTAADGASTRAARRILRARWGSSRPSRRGVSAAAYGERTAPGRSAQGEAGPVSRDAGPAVGSGRTSPIRR